MKNIGSSGTKNKKTLLVIGSLGFGFALGVLSWCFVMPNSSPKDGWDVMMETYAKSFYGFSQKSEIVAAPTLFPSGAYSVFAVPDMVKKYSKAEHISESPWFDLDPLSPPSPSCSTDIDDAFGLKHVHLVEAEVENEEFLQRRSVFNGYVKYENRYFFMGNNLIFDGKKYYLTESNLSNILYKTLKKCGKAEEARDRKLPLPLPST